jgi:8-oxo-dGTP pyrophosphatase MutT (NUDIX family)
VTEARLTRKATLCFLLREGDAGLEVLLALKKRGFGQGKWNGIGGKVDASETVEEAARREVAEEVGVEVGLMTKVACLTFHFLAPGSDPDWSQEVHVFLTWNWSGEPVESEEMRPEWYTCEEVPYGDMWADDRIWLPRVLWGERVIGVFTFSDTETIVQQDITVWQGATWEALRIPSAERPAIGAPQAPGHRDAV